MINQVFTIRKMKRWKPNVDVCCSNHLLERYLWYADFSKALSWLSSSRDYKRTRKGALAALLLYLYKYNVVHAKTMCLPHVLLLIHHASTSRPPCHVHVPWHHTLLISVTMCAPYVHHCHIQARLPRWPPFSQHVLWRCCNPLGIPSSTAEILLFNSVFHDGVAPVSISTLKSPLGAIGVLPQKPWVSPIISVLYIRLVVTL